MRWIGSAIVIVLSLASSPASAEEPTCRSAYGKTACGYHCVAAYDDVQCAQTPHGRCMAAYNQVVCGDPPRALTRRGQPPAGFGCKAAYNKIACGYECVAAYNDLQCTRTPHGRCMAAYNQVVCADPPRRWLRGHQAPPRIECKAAYNQIACGYGCVAAYNDVRCAQTPAGRCTSSHGSVTCWDPR